MKYIIILAMIAIHSLNFAFSHPDHDGQDAGTISLFNGKDLSGWRIDAPKMDNNIYLSDDKEVPPPFVVKNGLLISKGKPKGHLITNKVYQNYRLTVTYRFPGRPGNCGVLVHSSTPRQLYDVFPQSLEVQMMHKNAGDFWCILEDIQVPNMIERRGPKKKWGVVRGKNRRIANLTDNSEKPLGQWNTMIIECVDREVKVWVNGELVNHGTDCTANKGQIALQAEGSVVEFKTLLLTPISQITADHHKQIKVLLIDGQNSHNWRKTTPVIVKAFATNPRFKVDVTTAPDKKKGTKEQWAKWRPDFSQYDVVFGNYDGQAWPNEVKVAFEKFIKNGGGYSLFHAANNSFPKWKEYNKMTGLGGWGRRNQKDGPYVYIKDGKIIRDNSKGNGGAHGRSHEYLVHTYDAEHPIMKGIPTKWKHSHDELYDSLRGPAENMKILAYSYSPRTKRNEPNIMILTYGKGRIYHTIMGHDPRAINCVGFVDTMLRGTEWAATGKVTIPLSKNFPNESAPVPFFK